MKVRASQQGPQGAINAAQDARIAALQARIEELERTKGMVVGAMGENPGTPGAGIASVGNGSRHGAALAVVEDGSGVVHAFRADCTVSAPMMGVGKLRGCQALEIEWRAPHPYGTLHPPHAHTPSTARDL